MSEPTAQIYAGDTSIDSDQMLRRLATLTAGLQSYVAGPFGKAYGTLILACETIYDTQGADQNVRTLFHRLKGAALSGFVNRLECVEAHLEAAQKHEDPVLLKDDLESINDTLRGINRMYENMEPTTLRQLGEAIAQSGMSDSKKQHAQEQLAAFTAAFRHCVDMVDEVLGKEQGIALR